MTIEMIWTQLPSGRWVNLSLLVSVVPPTDPPVMNWWIYTSQEGISISAADGMALADVLRHRTYA